MIDATTIADAGTAPAEFETALRALRESIEPIARERGVSPIVAAHVEEAVGATRRPRARGATRAELLAALRGAREWLGPIVDGMRSASPAVAQRVAAAIWEIDRVAPEAGGGPAGARGPRRV